MSHRSVTAIGLDVHYKSSSVTMRNKEGKLVARQRLEHRDGAAGIEKSRKNKKKQVLLPELYRCRGCIVFAQSNERNCLRGVHGCIWVSGNR